MKLFGKDLQMRIEKMQTANEEIDKRMVVACESCKTSTEHKILASIDNYYQTEEDKYWESYQIIQCQGCNNESFRKINWSTDDYDLEGHYHPFEEIFPSRIEGRGVLKDFHHIPEKIRKIYLETDEALCNKQYILAGIGIRIIIEAVCKQKRVKGRDLKEKINKLAELKMISAINAKVLHKSRILGNYSAHEIKDYDYDKLLPAIDAVENILKAIYILPKASAVLPREKRRKKAKIAVSTPVARP